MNRRALLAAFGALPFVPKVAAAVPAVAAAQTIDAQMVYNYWLSHQAELRIGEEFTIAGVTSPKTGKLVRFRAVGVHS